MSRQGDHPLKFLRVQIGIKGLLVIQCSRWFYLTDKERQLYSDIGQLLQLKASVAESGLTPSERQFMAAKSPATGRDAAGDVTQLLALSHARGAFDIKAGPWLVLLAVLLGMATLVGLMQTVSGHPINLLYVLLVFGPMQWLLMVMGVVTMVKGNTPLLAPLLSKGLGQATFPKRLASALFFHLNQSLSVVFSLSALATFFALLAFRDLSFGWQTTFQWTPNAVTSVLEALALPWASWWPEAVPSQDWVLQTRFVRLSSQEMGTDAAMAFGQWWPFIVAFMLFYSLLPRCVLWLIAHWLLKTQTLQWVAHDVALQAMLSQGQSNAEDLAISDHPSVNSKGTVGSVAALPLPLSVLPAADTTWYWKVAAPTGNTLMQLGLPEQWQQDQQRLADQAQASRWNVVVPGWEAPTAELADLMSDAQNTHAIHVILQPLNRPLSRGQQSSWEQFMRERLPQAQLSVWTETL